MSVGARKRDCVGRKPLSGKAVQSIAGTIEMNIGNGV